MRFGKLLAFCLAATAALVACVQTVSSEGDRGLLRFSLITRLDVQNRSLTAATMVTRYQHEIRVYTTRRGDEEIKHPENIIYRMNAPGEISLERSSDEVPDMMLRVDEAGPVSIRAFDSTGSLVDSIRLQFADPASMRLNVTVRQPWTGTFVPQPATAPSEVTEGAQATFLPILLSKDDGKLLGNVRTDITVTPRWAAVPGSTVVGLYEDEVWASSGSFQFYFIEPTTVTMQMRDQVHEVTGAHTFHVRPATGS